MMLCSHPLCQQGNTLGDPPLRARLGLATEGARARVRSIVNAAPHYTTPHSVSGSVGGLVCVYVGMGAV